MTQPSRSRETTGALAHAHHGRARDDGPVDPLTARLSDAGVTMFLLPYAAYVVHTIEELPGFAAWASRHFAAHRTMEFAVVHIPLLLIVLLCGLLAMRIDRPGLWLIVTSAFSGQFAVNALFHVVTTIVFQEYSPGLVTGAAVSIPLTVIYFAWARRTGRLGVRAMVLSLSLGFALAGAAIGSLFL